MADKSAADLEREIDDLCTELQRKADVSFLTGLISQKGIESTALKSNAEAPATQSRVRQETRTKPWEKNQGS
ncbi:hypothetical protein ACWGKW_42325 [Streptomyces sp. NPDC054766]